MLFKFKFVLNCHQHYCSLTNNYFQCFIAIFYYTGHFPWSFQTKQNRRPKKPSEKQRDQYSYENCIHAVFYFTTSKALPV